MKNRSGTARCWTIWLKTRAQRLTAFSVLFMALLGIFGCHQHTHSETPTIVPTTVVSIRTSGGPSGGNSGAAAVTLPPLSVRAQGMVFPVDSSFVYSDCVLPSKCPKIGLEGTASDG
jgi:hypothetical protein